MAPGLPLRRAGARAAAHTDATRSWWSRWWPAWKLRWRAGHFKFNFDLHRASGLWLWAMLFVLAWSGVAFNLTEVYTPVMRGLLSQQQAQPNRSHIAPLAQPRPTPTLAPRQALEVGRTLMTQQTAQRGIDMEQEDWLGYDPERGVYTFIVRTSRDVRERHGGNTRLFFDGNTGEFRGIHLPTGEAAGDTVTTWITALHMASMWGWPCSCLSA